MLDLSNKQSGDKLIWDTTKLLMMGPVDVSKGYEDSMGRVLHPCVVANTSEEEDFIIVKWHGDSSKASGEVDYLREPTEEELDTLTWPI